MRFMVFHIFWYNELHFTIYVSHPHLCVAPPFCEYIDPLSYKWNGRIPLSTIVLCGRVRKTRLVLWNLLLLYTALKWPSLFVSHLLSSYWLSSFKGRNKKILITLLLDEIWINYGISLLLDQQIGESSRFLFNMPNLFSCYWLIFEIIEFLIILYFHCSIFFI